MTKSYVVLQGAWLALMLGVTAAAWTIAPGVAYAQDFSGTYTTLSCLNSAQLNDPPNDSNSDYRDIVASSTSTGIAYREDGTYAYFRLNLMDSAKGAGFEESCTTANSNHFKSFGWGLLFDFDGDPSTFEVSSLIRWTGSVHALLLYTNSTSIALNDPTDPPDANEFSTYNPCTHTYAEDPATGDHFIYYAVPIADLLAAANAVVEPDLPSLNGRFTVWAGTSNNGQTLSEDNTCNNDSLIGTPTLVDTRLEPIIVGTTIEIDYPADGGTVGSVRPEFRGTAEPNATVTVSIGPNIASVVSLPNGSWTAELPVNVNLVDGGNYSVTATADDGVNQKSASHNFTVNLAVDSDQDGFADADEACDTEPTLQDPTGPDTTCDGVDDDCNGLVDDGIAIITSQCGIGACESAGVIACVDGDMVDSCTAGTPAADDTLCDAIDNDCDGELDEDFASDVCDPSGACELGYSECLSPGAYDCIASPLCLDDPDGDGVCNGALAVPGICIAAADNCPDDENSDQGDLDGDSQGDACDTDIDDDGVCNGVNGDSDCVAGPDAASRNPSVCIDADEDSCDDCSQGMLNPAQDGPDRDEDGICDDGEDSDGDGIRDGVDEDDDNDGIPDFVEDAAGDGDADGDGLENRLELDSDGDGIFDSDEAGFGPLDMPRDGRLEGAVGDNGIPDAVESDGQDGGEVPAPPDSDEDTLADFIDEDSDGDGLSDRYEAGDEDVLSAPRDSDEDGDADYRDLDDDNDGIPSAAEAPDENNDGDPRDARNSDEDDLADYLDDDDDGDSILSEIERRDETALKNGPSDGDDIPAYLDDDADDDGALDSAEGTGDRNEDGVPDYLDPDVTAPDSDKDGVADEWECPETPCQDSDKDGTPDFQDEDDDGDTVPTSTERKRGDTDKDELPDYLDADDDGDGVGTRIERAEDDTDGDETPDYLDDDDDGDGVPTSSERIHGDEDDDSIADYLDDDDDGDGVPTAEELADGDSDLDGAPNYLDRDDDNDDILTVDEPGDRNRNGLPDRLEPFVEMLTISGGACAVGRGEAGAEGALLGLLALGWMRLRRRRHGRPTAPGA